MSQRPVEILLIEDDMNLAGMVGEHLQDVFWSQVTHVTNASQALREELTTRHDAIICSLTLADAEGMSLVREIRAGNHAPIIVTAHEPTMEEAMEAIQLRVTEMLIKPFDLAHLSTVVQTAAERYRKRLYMQKKNRRLRKIASRIVRERQDLRQRMDLVCRDFVHAYRRLAQKVAESGKLTEHLQE